MLPSPTSAKPTSRLNATRRNSCDSVNLCQGCCDDDFGFGQVRILTLIFCLLFICATAISPPLTPHCDAQTRTCTQTSNPTYVFRVDRNYGLSQAFYCPERVYEWSTEFPVCQWW